MLEIKAKNLKSKQFTQIFNGLDLLAGDNGTGKTSRLQAILISLLGYDPAIGKQSMSTLQLSADDEKKSLEVKLEMEEMKIKRDFSMKKAHAVLSTSVEGKMPDYMEDMPDETKIKLLTGALPVFFDISEFASLSDDKKKLYLFSFIDTKKSGWTKEYIDKEIATALSRPEEKTLLPTILEAKAEKGISFYLLALYEAIKDLKLKAMSEKKDAEAILSEYKDYSKEKSEEKTATAKSLQDLEKERGEYNRQLIKIDKEIALSYERMERLKERGAEIAFLQTEIEELKKRKEEIKCPHGHDDCKLLIDAWKSSDMETKEKRLKELLDKEAKDVAPVDPKMLYQRKEGIKTNLEEIDKQIKSKTYGKATLSNFNKAQIRIEEAKLKVEFYKKMEKKAGPKGLMADLMKQVRKPFIDKVNEFLECIDKDKQFDIKLYDEKKEKEIFEFGWKKGERFIPFDSLSNGEKAFFGIALCCAFLLIKNPPLKILMFDNVERIDAGRRKMLYEGLQRLKDKYEIDYVILAGVVSPSEISGNWKISHLIGTTEKPKMIMPNRSILDRDKGGGRPI